MTEMRTKEKKDMTSELISEIKHNQSQLKTVIDRLGMVLKYREERRLLPRDINELKREKNHCIECPKDFWLRVWRDMYMYYDIGDSRVYLRGNNEHYQRARGKGQ